MSRRAHLYLAAVVVAVACMFAALPVAHAGGTIYLDKDQETWINIGSGLRTSFSTVEDAAPNGTDWSNDFAINHIRLYINGQIHENIKFEFNTEQNFLATGYDIRIIAAIAKLEFHDLFKVWAGHMVPPSDRSDLSGPFYMNAWDWPFVHAYPMEFAGHDDGATIWGQYKGGKFKYQVGAFEGRDGAGTSNQSDNLLYAGRLTLNLLDPEPFGYYNASTYYGAINVLALGFVVQYQEDGAGTAAAPGDFTGWNIDALFETNLGNRGVITLEGAYYDYDRENIVSASEGEAYMIVASYLFPKKIGIGKLQPQFRYQNFDRDSGGERDRYEGGMSYIMLDGIAGHNARISAFYAEEDPGPGLSNISSFKIGVQLQL